MLLIDCPYCGTRDQSEFSYGGEAHIVRPLKPDSLSDEEWADYLFMRTNPKRCVPGTVVPLKRLPSVV